MEINIGADLNVDNVNLMRENWKSSEQNKATSKVI